MATIYQPESFYETTLAASVGAADATISITTAPTITSGYLVIEASTVNREIIQYTGVTGTTLTGCVRGLASFGTDDSAGTGTAHTAGAEIAQKDVHYYIAAYNDFIVGTSATGYNSFKIGDGNTISSSNRLWYAQTSSLSAYWGLSASGQMIVSEDGVNSYVISAGGSGVAGGEGTTITAGQINLALLSTGGLEISASKAAVGVSSLIIRDTNGLRVDTTSAMEWSGIQGFNGGINVAQDKLSSGATAILATGAEINQMVSGVSAYSSLSPYSLDQLRQNAIQNTGNGTIADSYTTSTVYYKFENTGFQPKTIFGPIAISTQAINYGNAISRVGMYDASDGMNGVVFDDATDTFTTTGSWLYEWRSGSTTNRSMIGIESVATSGFTLQISSANDSQTHYFGFAYTAIG